MQPFVLTEHQASFGALKKTSTTALVLSYPDFSKEFVLETDALLKGIGDVLSQVGSDRKTCVIVYASTSLYPSERSIQSYNAAKLRLLALKWL